MFKSLKWRKSIKNFPVVEFLLFKTPFSIKLPNDVPNESNAFSHSFLISILMMLILNVIEKFIDVCCTRVYIVQLLNMMRLYELIHLGGNEQNRDNGLFFEEGATWGDIFLHFVLLEPMANLFLKLLVHEWEDGLEEKLRQSCF